MEDEFDVSKLSLWAQRSIRAFNRSLKREVYLEECERQRQKKIDTKLGEGSRVYQTGRDLMPITLIQLSKLAEHFGFDENEAIKVLGETMPTNVSKAKGVKEPSKTPPKAPKEPKDPKEPKAPKEPKEPKEPNAYHKFMRVKCNEVKRQNFGATAREIQNECRAMWGGMTKEEKEVWK